MPKYFYSAKSFKGEPRTGNLEAKDERELARMLHQEDYVLISASIEKESKKAGLSLSSFSGLFRVSLTEKIIFVRNLEVMFSAGIPLPRAISILAEQTKNKKFRNALLEISEDLIKGKGFSDSMAKYPDIFSELFSSMVKIGEEAGTLETSLKNITFQMEREYELASKVKGALIYPAVIICTMVGIGILMLVMVVPKLAGVFNELNMELPITTRLVIFLGTFLLEKWYLLIGGLIAVVLFFRMYAKTEKGKKMIDGLILKIPVIAPIIKKTNAARVIRTLSVLIASGVPIVRALEIVGGSSGNFYFKKALFEAADSTRKGSKISEALRPHIGLFPDLVVRMVEVGEETGQSSDILAKLADFFEVEVSNVTKNLASIIEPVLMLIIGASVGFFAVSMIQPMYSVMQGL